MRNAHLGGVHRIAFTAIMVLAMSCGLTACKPTDFFTEVVISPFAQTIDYDNPDKTVVNSPDAEEESGDLAALQWTEQSSQSKEMQNLVVYGSEPNSALTTHHSLFDLYPLFSGIESSDSVRLLFDAAADLDHETNPTDVSEAVRDAVSRSAGASASQQSDQAISSADATTGTTGGTTEAGDNPNGNASDPDNSGKGSGPNSDNGSSNDPYAGYDGTVTVYDPNNAFAQVNRVNHLAVLGQDAAVMAQSIGGSGAISAMSEYAYDSIDSSTGTTQTYRRFVDIFGGEMPSDFQTRGLLWSRDGSSPSDVKDIDALVSACGQNGVIVYDQTLGDQTTLFNLDQRKRIQAAGIQLVPVDMSTVQGMLDAARVVGDALSQSTECAQDSSAMATSYVQAVNNIVKSVSATNGGYLASSQGGFRLLTKYNELPVGNYRSNNVYSYLATDSESGLSYTAAGFSLDVSGIVLFENGGGFLSTPLFFWQQAVGIQASTNGDGNASTGLKALWPISGVVDATTLSGGGAGGARARWLGSNAGTSAMSGRALTTSELVAKSGYGLGSDEVPYLIVCDSNGKSAGQVKNAVVQSMASYSQSGVTTLYSALPYASDGGIGLSPSSDAISPGVSTLGSTNGKTSKTPFYTGLSLSDVVRENPTGLLGSWTEGTMESVLEAVWLADIYSTSPSGCSYQPITNMSNFSVDIGGTTCTTTRQAVLAFYQTFYRCDASGAYNSIVTDEGL